MNMSQLPDHLLPPGCAFAAVPSGPESLAALLPEEALLLSPKAVEKRRVEFAAGRHVARLALAEAGFTEPFPILRGARGEPLWPAGWVGSISHGHGWAVAAVGPHTSVRSLGVDFESARRKVNAAGIARLITGPSEQAWCFAEGEGTAQLRLKLIFSAKESLFKTLYPIVNVFFDFHDAEAVWNEAEGRFDLRLLRTLSEEFCAGKSLAVAAFHDDEHILTTAFLESIP